MTERAEPSVTEQRSRIMSAIRGKDTKPELAVRSHLHRSGLRFSLHRKDLPGRPDVVLRARRTAVFVHGCFWHGHSCRKGRLPATRTEFWRAKIEANKSRDARNEGLLRAAGWAVDVAWECELGRPGFLDDLAGRIRARPARSRDRGVTGA